MLALTTCEEPPMPAEWHQPVLLAETLRGLAPRPGALLVDGTLGDGGHAEALLEALGPHGRLVGIDCDAQAHARAAARLARFGERFIPLAGRHEDLVALMRDNGILAVDGILFDLGTSSLQLDDPQRGFSFRHDGPLDMRMNPHHGRTAAELLASSSEDDLRRLIYRYGEERQAGAIARAIVRRREQQPFTRTVDLARLVQQVLGPQAQRYRIHPATRTFQALRIAVNEEVESLGAAVSDAVSLLRPHGRIVVIAYHSLEDRAVKHTLRGLAHRCTCPPRLPVCGCGKQDLVRLVNTRAVTPDAREVHCNPRARSARLRIAERL